MKKIYWIPLVLLLFFVGDRAGGWILKQLTDGSQFRYSRLYNEGAAAEVLLVGNSRGLIFYQPYIEEKTGKSTFNISYNGMPINLAKTLVEDYLDAYPQPALMVLDVTMCDRLNSKLISGFNLYTPYSDRLTKLLIDSIPESGYGGKLSHLFRYNSEVFQRSLYYRNRSDEDWLLDRVINDHMVQTVDQSDSLTFEMIPSVLNDLVALVELARTKNIQVQLVVNPYYPPFAKRFENFKPWLAQIEAATGLSVKDYSQAISDVNGFGDYQHLNKTGGQLYIDQLLKDGVFNAVMPSTMGGVE